MSAMDPNDSLITSYLYDMVYNFEHKTNRSKHNVRQKKLCIEILFSIYVLLFLIGILLAIFNQMWFIFDFEHVQQAGIVLIMTILLSAKLIVTKIKKKQKGKKYRVNI